MTFELGDTFHNYESDLKGFIIRIYSIIKHRETINISIIDNKNRSHSYPSQENLSLYCRIVLVEKYKNTSTWKKE